MELYINQQFICTLRAVKSKVIEHIFECVTVELDMKKRRNIFVNCVYRHRDQTWTYFVSA